MKLNSKFFLAAILTPCMVSYASANMLIDVYAGGTFGAGGSTVFDYDAHKNYFSQSFGGVVGIDIPLLRIEAEYNHITNDDLSTNEAMLNTYFKMVSTVIHPYIGVGVGSVFGGSIISSNDIKYDTKTTVAYQGMLGLTFDILALPLKFDVEGRALYAPNFTNIETQKPDLLQYDARMKLRYIF